MRAKIGLQIVAVGACIAAVAACGSSSKTAATPATSASSGGASSSSGGSGGGTATGTPIKIGNIGVYSGFSSETAVPANKGLQAWASYTNAHGGINGHPVQVIVKDDGGVPATSLQDVKELIQQDHVVAIVGQDESGLEDAWAPYAQAQKVPVIGGAANGGSWLTNPNMFPAAGTVLNTQAVTANAVRLDGKNHYSIIYCAEVPACAQAGTIGKGVAQKLGIGFAGFAAVSASASSYTAQCLQLKGEGADSTFIATAIDTGLRFLAQCKTQGFTPTPVDDTRNWSAKQLTNPLWSNALLVGESPWWFGNDPATQTFQAAYKQYQGDQIENSNSTLGWTAGVVFGAAAKAGGTSGSDVTTAEIYKGLYSLGANYDAGGLMPPTTYTEGKPASQPKACGWYAKVVNGAYTLPQGAARVCLG